MDDVSELLQSKRTQYNLLQSRIERHGSKMWQLPLTYLGAIAIGITAVTRGNLNINIGWLFGFLTALGVLLLWAFFSALEGYLRTGKHMMRLESELKLKVTTATPKKHYLPYILMIVLGIVLCLYLMDM